MSIRRQRDIRKIEEASRVVAGTLAKVGEYVRPGVSTLELDQIAEDFIRSHEGRPAFKGYEVDGKIFPYTLCISVNDEVVHGMPGPRKLENGDIVSVDCGCEKDGHFGDSAYTFAVGQISDEKAQLLKVTEESLYSGIEKAVAGNKIYDIARAIQEHVEQHGFSVVRELVGHGIGTELHEEPPVPNFVPALIHRKKFPNVKLQPGLTLAIEPMVNAGSFHVRTSHDGWTIRTADGRPSAHFEHTVLVDDNKAVILTLQ